MGLILGVIVLLSKPCVLYCELPACAKTLVGAIIGAVAPGEEALVLVDVDTLLRNRDGSVVDIRRVGGVVAVGSRDWHPLLTMADIVELDMVWRRQELLHGLHPGVEGEEVKLEAAAGHPVVLVHLLHAPQPSATRGFVQYCPVASGHRVQMLRNNPPKPVPEGDDQRVEWRWQRL